MARTFHKFSLLPGELREKIWCFAIRPTGDDAPPSAHIFKLGQDAEVGDLVNPSCSRLVVPFYTASSKCDGNAASVRDGEAGDNMDNNATAAVVTEIKSLASYEPTKGGEEEKRHVSSKAKRTNWSAYLLDGGLWTACKESRSYMERAFDQKRYDGIRAAHARDYLESLTIPGGWFDYQVKMDARAWQMKKLPSTNYFGCYNGAEDDDNRKDNTGSDNESSGRWLTVLPHRDLVCLDLSGYPSHPSVIREACSISLWDHKAGFYRIKHVALDFGRIEEHVRSEKYEPVIDWLFQAGFEEGSLCPGMTLWFIDNEASVMEGIETSFQAADRRFVSMGWSLRGSVTAWDDNGYETRCSRFVNRLIEKVQEEEDYSERYDRVLESETCDIHFGLLAWEYL